MITFLEGTTLKSYTPFFASTYLLTLSIQPSIVNLGTFYLILSPIYVTAELITCLTEFLREHKDYNKSLFMKVVKRLKEHFVYSIKIGFRDPLIKKNGDTLVRYPKTNKKIPKNNFSPAVSFC